MPSLPKPTVRDSLQWIHLGHREYRKTLQIQLAQWEKRTRHAVPDTIFTVEHNPVITLGKRGKDQDILVSQEALRQRHIDVVHIDRGGEATWHGPGQLVLYPIIDIRHIGIGPSDLVRALAHAIQRYLATIGIDAQWNVEHPGVWVDDRKIAAVGMRIQQGVSRHGAALNLHTAQDAFQIIVPCGLPEFGVTSVLEQSGRRIPLHTAADAITTFFTESFWSQRIVADDPDVTAIPQNAGD